ncbi:pantoate--beta-alanine ligase [Deferribacteraceae bacterium V6Fe1]|nr:pantoate--beta-alanine ligase [Deferribacteraceae bacterium V6Fe1]
MIVINKIEDLRKTIKKAKSEGKKIGFVPTMGYLHEGHLSLIKKAKSENNIVVCSIFVNPTQFGPNEDLDKYPRDFERDKSLLEKEDCDIIFYPSVQEMYPNGFFTKVSLSILTDKLCGKSRPGHFDGVATVVTKLLNIVAPDNAYFGLKDYQQLLVIKRVVDDLNIDTNIVGCPIVREEDGLAMSSRNVYLTEEQRMSALSLNKSFALVEELLSKGVKDSNKIKGEVANYIEGFPFTKIDYIEIVDPETLEDIKEINGNFLMALAVFVGKARLIDNNVFKIN